MSFRDELAEHCARAPRAVLYDPDAALLLDLPSGKTLPLPEAQLQSVEARPDPRTGQPTLAFQLLDGRVLGLTAGGVSFPPAFTHTGALEELPAAVCWSDLQPLLQQLKHELYGPPGVTPSGATVRVLMCCLAILDGARAAGFDVAAEELELEWHLKELERRAPS